MCQSICNSSTETVQDDRDEIGGKEESIIEAGKVYNSRLNVVVYSLISGTFLALKIWLYICVASISEINCVFRAKCFHGNLCSISDLQKL